MPFPTNDRLKNLNDLFQDQTPSPYYSHPFSPPIYPGVVVGYIDRADTGQCLQVIPFTPKSVTTAGDVTFTDGNSLIPSTIVSYLKVYPLDAAPADVSTMYPVGQVIFFFPFDGPGQLAQKVKGTFVCIATGGGGGALPAPEFQYQILTGIDNNVVWDVLRFGPSFS